MRKLIIAAVIASLAGCSIQSHDPEKPAVTADKGSYFAQNKKDSIASNLVAFAGYPYLISDHDMPSDLKAGLDFTSGAYMGFNSFSSLLGSGGIGALSALTGDNIRPFGSDSVILMVPLQAGEKYNDLAVAKRAFETYLKKIDASLIKPDSSSAAYKSELARKKFAEDANMSGANCRAENAALGLLSGADARCGLGDYDVEIYFSRPATGREFPELSALPKGQYSVMLFNLYYNYAVRSNAPWAAAYDDSQKVFKFKNLTLPFVSPDRKDGGKRIVIDSNNKVLYL